MIHLFIIGLVSILGQAVLLRELSVAFYGVDLIYVLAFGFWLIWTALGAVVGKGNLHPSEARVQRLFFLFALLLLLDLVFIRALRILFSGVPGAYLPFISQILAMLIALLPPGILSGLTFQWAAKRMISGHRTLAAAYAIESAGGLAGGLCATLFLKFGMRNLSIAMLCAVLSLSVVLIARTPGTRRLRAAAACAAILIVIVLPFAAPLDWAMTAWSHPYLVDSQDSPYSRVSVTRQGGQIAVYENDALSFQTEGTAAEEFVHMAALLHPRPARVLILGGGIQGIVRETLKHAPDRIDYVELNSRLFSIAVPLLPADLRQSLSAAPVRLHTDDPRRFLARQENYDLILIGMPEPDSGQTNRYYTLEFFRQCAARLMPGGIVAFRLRSSENIWTRQLTARAVSIYRSLRLALPQVLVLPGGADIYAASREPLPHEPALLAARLDTRGIETRLVSAPYIRYLYQNDRFARIAQTLATGTAPLNTDARPVCYSFTLMIWLSKFYPDLAGWDPSSLASWSNTHMAWLLAAGLAVAVLFLLSRRRAGMRRALFVGTAGFAGMVLETLFVLHYQVKSGVLYQDIGLLLMSFMAGLALGALALDRWASAHASRIPSWCGPLLAGSFAAISLAASARIRASSGGGMLETSVFLAATGFMVSAVLAYASLEGVRDQREVVAPLYASDLVGGCLGSFAGSLLLIPFAGMDTAAVLMAPLVLLSALLSRPGRMT